MALAQLPNRNTTEIKPAMPSSQASAQTITMDNNRRVLPRIHVSSPPPSPPLISFIAALAIVMLILMCISVFSFIVSLLIFLFLYITGVFLCWFFYDNRELDIPMRDRTFRAQTPQNNQRAVGILDRLLWVVEERGNQRQQRSYEKLFGSVVCFGSPAVAAGCSDCAICLEDFHKGEECRVFPVCGHLFHSCCISHWLEKKLTCPICRHCICISSTGTMITGTRSTELLVNLV